MWDKVSLHSEAGLELTMFHGWPRTGYRPPASTSRELGWQVSTTMPGLKILLKRFSLRSTECFQLVSDFIYMETPLSNHTYQTNQHFCLSCDANFVVSNIHKTQFFPGFLIYFFWSLLSRLWWVLIAVKF